MWVSVGGFMWCETCLYVLDIHCNIVRAESMCVSFVVYSLNINTL